MVISMAMAMVVTAVLLYFTDNMDSIRPAMAIVIVGSGVPSYLIARLVVHYQHIVETQNAELLHINQELAISNAELEAYAHTVAHDLKNPLFTIRGYAGVLRRQLNGATSPKALEMVGHIETSSLKMDSIIRELLLLSQVRNQEVETAVLNMHELVAHAEAQLAGLIQQSGGQISYPAEWPTAVGYAPWVEEVWMNYLSNGLKYGGRPPQLTLGAAYQNDHMVRFWVQDNGPGIPPDKESLLFKEFTRLDTSRNDSYGLGLSIVYRIIEKLGGEVDVESKPGQGTLFYFTLPGENHVSQYQTTTAAGAPRYR
ncbi:MAG TPA: HAMP domain-containing sensor histidine kinase [Chloroflexota bacterium]|nr:HAMP domain-containing sensor histidine kinase [Chloroflexota bacterium]